MAAYISRRGAQHLWVDTKECGDTTSCGISVIIVYVEIFTMRIFSPIFATCFHWQKIYNTTLLLVLKLVVKFGMQALARDTKQGLVP